jgi:4-hydroxy-3-polyprenylbenzoate decarboxylase
VPDQRVPEGPFGEYTGYRTAQQHSVPPYRVKAITHRNNPILTMSNVGMPVDDNHAIAAVSYSVMLKNHFLRQGIPVADVYFPPEFAYHLAIVGVKGRQPDVARQIQAGMTRALAHARVIVVDEDVDIFNVNEAMHAFFTRCHPMNGILASEHDLVHTLMVHLTPQDRELKKGSHVVFDCTWPLDWDMDAYVPHRVYFKEMYPQAVRDKVLKEWPNYGFKE